MMVADYDVRKLPITDELNASEPTRTSNLGDTLRRSPELWGHNRFPAAFGQRVWHIREDMAARWIRHALGGLLSASASNAEGSRDEIRVTAFTCLEALVELHVIIPLNLLGDHLPKIRGVSPNTISPTLHILLTCVITEAIPKVHTTAL